MSSSRNHTPPITRRSTPNTPPPPPTRIRRNVTTLEGIEMRMAELHAERDGLLERSRHAPPSRQATPGTVNYAAIHARRATNLNRISTRFDTRIASIPQGPMRLTRTIQYRHDHAAAIARETARSLLEIERAAERGRVIRARIRASETRRTATQGGSILGRRNRSSSSSHGTGLARIQRPPVNRRRPRRTTPTRSHIDLLGGGLGNLHDLTNTEINQVMGLVRHENRRVMPRFQNSTPSPSSRVRQEE